jgi:hypothetical protein
MDSVKGVKVLVLLKRNHDMSHGIELISIASRLVADLPCACVGTQSEATITCHAAILVTIVVHPAPLLGTRTRLNMYSSPVLSFTTRAEAHVMDDNALSLGDGWRVSAISQL